MVWFSMRLIPLLIGLSIYALHAQESQLLLSDVKKIWDQAPHNAFTDLILAKDQWFCVFRESSGHVGGDGAIRVLASQDGENWQSVALLTSDQADLRDPKITLTPGQQLMITAAAAWHDKSRHTHQSMTWFSADGRTWSEPSQVADPDYWLWRVVWYDQQAFGFGYACGEDKGLRWYGSQDGRHFRILNPDMGIEGYPNETALVFRNDTAICLLRRDGAFPNAMLGKSAAPFLDWEWTDLGVRIGGPQMVLLPDGRLIAAVRLYGGEGWQPARTAICFVDEKTSTLEELFTLPSGGDTSYPGMVIKDKQLWISYYSSHEEKTAIYLAIAEMTD